MQSRTQWMYILIALIALFGVLNAGYLVWTSITGTAPTCNFIKGCDVVASSSYSYIFGIPLSLFGVFFYTLVFGFALWRIIVPQEAVLKYIFPLSIIGFVLSLYFLYLQAFVIEAYCEYCLFSLFDATVLFALSTYMWMRRSEEGTMEELET